jgi:hypothetical protein
MKPSTGGMIRLGVGIHRGVRHRVFEGVGATRDFPPWNSWSDTALIVADQAPSFTLLSSRRLVLLGLLVQRVAKKSILTGIDAGERSYSS